MNQGHSESYVESLIDYFTQLIPLNPDEKNIVKANFHPRLYRRRQYLLQEGNMCTQLYYVVRGCVRMYKIDDKGNTHIIQFAAEKNWINDLGSFHQLQPSSLNIDALEDTAILQISRDDLINLYLQAPKFDRIFRVLLENSYVRLQSRLLQNISSTAEDRYNAFMEVYPHLVNRIAQTQIAAYLGITPEFLSKLRNRKSQPGSQGKP